MSVLQNDVKPFLGRMLGGHHTDLDGDAQRVLAAWVVMTAITLQDANDRVAIPDEHAYAFYPRFGERLPHVPHQISVGLAHYTGQSTGLGFFIEHAIQSVSPEQDDLGGSSVLPVPIHRIRYWATLRIGPVAFHLLGHALPAPLEVEVKFEPSRVLGIAPIRDPAIDWPPPSGVNDSDLWANTTVLARIPWPSRVIDARLLVD